MKGIITNEERLKILRKRQEELREKVKGKSIGELWEFWKYRQDQILLNDGQELLRINKEIRTIEETLNRDKIERANKIDEERLGDRFFLEEIVFALKNYLENKQDVNELNHVKNLTSDWLSEMVEKIQLTNKQRKKAMKNFQPEINYFYSEEHLRNYLGFKEGEKKL